MPDINSETGGGGAAFHQTGIGGMGQGPAIDPTVVKQQEQQHVEGQNTQSAKTETAKPQPHVRDSHEVLVEQDQHQEWEDVYTVKSARSFNYAQSGAMGDVYRRMTSGELDPRLRGAAGKGERDENLLNHMSDHDVEQLQQIIDKSALITQEDVDLFNALFDEAETTAAEYVAKGEPPPRETALRNNVMGADVVSNVKRLDSDKPVLPGATVDKMPEGPQGAGNPWFNPSPMVAYLVNFMEMVSMLKYVKVVEARTVVAQMTITMELAKSAAGQVLAAAEKEAMMHYMMAATAAVNLAATVGVTVGGAAYATKQAKTETNASLKQQETQFNNSQSDYNNSANNNIKNKFRSEETNGKTGAKREQEIAQAKKSGDTKKENELKKERDEAYTKFLSKETETRRTERNNMDSDQNAKEIDKAKKDKEVKEYEREQSLHSKLAEKKDGNAYEDTDAPQSNDSRYNDIKLDKKYDKLSDSDKVAKLQEKKDDAFNKDMDKWRGKVGDAGQQPKEPQMPNAAEHDLKTDVGIRKYNQENTNYTNYRSEKNSYESAKYSQISSIHTKVQGVLFIWTGVRDSTNIGVQMADNIIQGMMKLAKAQHDAALRMIEGYQQINRRALESSSEAFKSASDLIDRCLQTMREMTQALIQAFNLRG